MISICWKKKKFCVWKNYKMLSLIVNWCRKRCGFVRGLKYVVFVMKVVYVF